MDSAAFEAACCGQNLVALLMSASGINWAQACALLFQVKEESLAVRPLRLPVQHL